MIHRSISQKLDKTEENIEFVKGGVGSNLDKEGLMHSVLEANKDRINYGRMISEAINLGISSFNPDTTFEQIVKDYKLAKHIYGERILRLITGYDPEKIEKNIRLPEFRKELRNSIINNIEKLKRDGLIDSNGFFSDKGIELAALTLYFEEIEHLMALGVLGEKITDETGKYGVSYNIRNFKGDHYRDIELKNSVKVALRRGHRNLIKEDLRVTDKRSKGKSYLVYALDASGSMKGKKIEHCKRAGIALAFKAIEEKDLVGLIVFGAKIKKEIKPTNDFNFLLREIAKIRTGEQTNIADAIEHSINLFPDENITKHLIIITDALPTFGKDPEKDTLDAVSKARNRGITISLIGININKKGEKLASKIVEISKGRFYIVKDIEMIDFLVLEDYYSIKEGY